MQPEEREYEDVQKICAESETERERETAKKHNVCFFVSQLSIFQTPVFLPTLPSHQFLPPTALSSAKPLIRRYLLDDVLETLKKKKKSASDVYTQCCEHGSVLRFVFRPSSLSLSLSLFIPQWLTCFTSTAVISTAFTELINGAEGWVPLNWDNSFSLSLAHMDNCMEKHGKDGGRSAREGGRIHTQSGKTKTKLEGIDVEE